MNSSKRTRRDFFRSTAGVLAAGWAGSRVFRPNRAAGDVFELAGNYPPIANHVANFFDCVKTKNTPISDVVSQHRSVSTCHLVNISIRVGRKLTWDPKKERFVGDGEADRYLQREQRKGFEIPT